MNTYRKLLRIQPNNVDGYIALGSVLAELSTFRVMRRRRCDGRCNTPETPTVIQAAIHNNSGDRAQRQPKQALPGALERLETTQSLAPNLPSLDQRRIDRLHQLGRYDECLELYRELVGSKLLTMRMHRAYNSLLHRLGRKDEVLRLL